MKKPVFVLKNIQPDDIDKKYNLLSYKDKQTEPVPLPTQQNVVEPENKTKITELPINDDISYFSFLDESKKDHQCVVTMRSYLTKEDFPPNTSVHCFWCRHSFHFRPIGCPIDFVSDRLTKTYNSDITKDKYTLRENITKKQLEQLTKDVASTEIDTTHMIQNEYKIQDRNYYLMDGLFCSFNCCFAFIKANQQNPLYMNSEYLLKKIFYNVFGENTAPLIPSPSWRLLKEYGGHMTIEEYRKNFYKVDYFNVDNLVVPFPNSKPVGFLFEKQVKL